MVLGERRPNEVELHKKLKRRSRNDPQSTETTSIIRSYSNNENTEISCVCLYVQIHVHNM